MLTSGVQTAERGRDRGLAQRRWLARHPLASRGEGAARLQVEKPLDGVANLGAFKKMAELSFRFCVEGSSLGCSPEVLVNEVGLAPQGFSR